MRDQIDDARGVRGSSDRGPEAKPARWLRLIRLFPARVKLRHPGFSSDELRRSAVAAERPMVVEVEHPAAEKERLVAVGRLATGGGTAVPGGTPGPAGGARGPGGLGPRRWYLGLGPLQPRAP